MERLSKVKADLEKGRMSAKIQKQVKPMVAEAEQGDGIPRKAGKRGRLPEGKKSGPGSSVQDLQCQIDNGGEKACFLGLSGSCTRICLRPRRHFD